MEEFVLYETNLDYSVMDINKPYRKVFGLINNQNFQCYFKLLFTFVFLERKVLYYYNLKAAVKLYIGLLPY